MASDAEAVENMLGGNLAELEIYGSLTEPATGIRLREEQEPFMLFLGDEVYVSMGITMDAMAADPTADPAEIELAQRLAPDVQGKYLDVSADYESSVSRVDVAQLLEQMHSAAESGETDEVTGFNFHELQQEGSYMQLEMETDDTGWFYSVDGEDEYAIMNGEATQILGVVSDHEAPRLERITNDDNRMEFAWDDDVEIPVRPTEDQLMTEDDLMLLFQGQ